MYGKYPKPSYGSLICTFADCPDRYERISPSPNRHFTKLGFCPLGARANDFSACGNKGRKLSSNKSVYSPLFCEVACRDGICPRGFTR